MIGFVYMEKIGGDLQPMDLFPWWWKQILEP